MLIHISAPCKKCLSRKVCWTFWFSPTSFASGSRRSPIITNCSFCGGKLADCSKFLRRSSTDASKLSGHAEWNTNGSYQLLQTSLQATLQLLVEVYKSIAALDQSMQCLFFIAPECTFRPESTSEVSLIHTSRYMWSFLESSVFSKSRR